MNPRHRYRGPVKTIFAQVPSRYRRAVDTIKRERHLPIRVIILEAIELVAVKYEAVHDPSELNSILEFDGVAHRTGGQEAVTQAPS